MKLTQLLRICWARKWLFALVFCAIVGAAAAVSLLTEKSYVAVVSVMVDAKNTDPVTGAVLPPQLQSSVQATQVDVISSHNVALKVVEKLGLATDPEMLAEFQEKRHGQGSIHDWIADKLLDKLNVRPPRDSNVINIEFQAPTPLQAAQIANAFAESYIQTSLELRIDPAKRQTLWFDEQQQVLRKALEAAQTRLSDYQQRKNIVGTDDRLDVENAKMTEIASQLVSAQTAMYDAESRQRQMVQALEKNQLEELPDMLGNGLLQTMKGDLVRAEGKLAQVAQKYDRNHPEYVSAAAEVQTLKSRLAAEIGTVKGSISQSAQLARQRVAEGQRALDAQKQRILELKQQRDGLDVLNREAENAQRAYDAAMQRTSEVRLASRLDQTNIAVLNPATPPLKPAGPKVLRNMVLALLIGGLLAAGVALSAELLDRRVRSVADLAELEVAGGLAVLGEIPGLRLEPPKRSAAGEREAAAALDLQPA